MRHRNRWVMSKEFLFPGLSTLTKICRVNAGRRSLVPCLYTMQLLFNLYCIHFTFAIPEQLDMY
ncbi:hypothetical protein CHS0354_001000 [Potamilus streckersoni]|uniref:Uncharacterized protein n=1 Tax=Potamilus streckersoni TaxID=2493646 RepID=A0AAE0TEY9_9BIVA|nr:hypothetical protein CHS0354_001000 [Potamilus streckersoni]